MITLRKLAALVALLAAAVLLFAVVCPFTPTPHAVITARNSAPANSMAVAWTFVLPAIPLLFIGAVRFTGIADSFEIAPLLPVRKRTCVRLC